MGASTPSFSYHLGCIFRSRCHFIRDDDFTLLSTSLCLRVSYCVRSSNFLPTNDLRALSSPFDTMHIMCDSYRYPTAQVRSYRQYPNNPSIHHVLNMYYFKTSLIFQAESDKRGTQNEEMEAKKR